MDLKKIKNLNNYVLFKLKNLGHDKYNYEANGEMDWIDDRINHDLIFIYPKEFNIKISELRKIILNLEIYIPRIDKNETNILPVYFPDLNSLIEFQRNNFNDFFDYFSKIYADLNIDCENYDWKWSLMHPNFTDIIKVNIFDENNKKPKKINYRQLKI